MVRKCRELDAQITDCERHLAELHSEAKRLVELTIPDIMTTMELTTITTDDGLTVDVRPFVHVTIPGPLKRLAMDWLIAEGHGGIVKSEVAASFRAGDTAARELSERLIAEGLTVSLTEAVHASTLGKWGRDMVESGRPLPDCFTVYSGRKAIIKEDSRQ